MSIYKSKEKTWSIDGVEHTFYCGEVLDDVAMLSMSIFTGTLTLQEAYSEINRAIVNGGQLQIEESDCLEEEGSRLTLTVHYVVLTTEELGMVCEALEGNVYDSERDKRLALLERIEIKG